MCAHMFNTPEKKRLIENKTLCSVLQLLYDAILLENVKKIFSQKYCNNLLKRKIATWTQWNAV